MSGTEANNTKVMICQENLKENSPEPIDETVKLGIIKISHLPCVEGVFEDVLLIQSVFCYYIVDKRNAMQ